MIVNDLIYIMDGKTGTLYFAEARPDKYKQLGKVKILESENKMWAPLVYNDGKLYVRGHKYLKCLDVTSK